MERFVFLNEEQVREVRSRFGTPVFIYDQASLEARAHEVLDFPNAFGLTARYAMKALPTAAVIRILTQAGLHIDASSGFEAERAMRAGVPAGHIQLTAQELPGNLKELLGRGVLMNACSIEQLKTFGELCPGKTVTVRVNPGRGSGHSNKTNVGGPSASFGIWHEHMDRAMATARDFGVTIAGMHTHIGSGSDPEVWERCALMSLGIAAQLPDVTVLSLGGGYKVGRMPGEASTDLSVIGAHISEAFQAFAGDHGRRLHLEVEPGTYLVANAGALVCTVIDVVDTGTDGYRFIKVDAGMTEVLRPSLYGAQHPIASVAADDTPRDALDYLVSGHCCESGDLLTPDPGNPEGLGPRRLPETRIGDTIVVGGAGAYCAAMSAKNYNSFPEAAEVLLAKDGSLHLIRRRQTLDQIVANEVLDDLPV